jgi:hypothetical protein
MKPTTLAVSPLFAVLLTLSGISQAQSVGGFSAGPGLAPPQEKQVEQATPTAMPPVPGTVTETSAPESDDQNEPYETRVITYRKSPKYTQDREFTNARLWVLDPGRYTVEQWWTGYWGVPKALSQYGIQNQDDQFFQTEIEIGFAPHFQLDIYANYEFAQDQNTGNYLVAHGHTGIAAELRYAIPSYWGQVWGNPTLYFELTSQYYNSPRAEFRLLLGGSMFAPKLLGVVNFSFERNIFRDNSTGIDYEIKSQWGANYEIIKDILRLGAQATFGWDSHGTIGCGTVSAQCPQGGALGVSLIHPVAQIGPALIITEPHKYFKVLASLMYGFADWDAPWQSQIILSSTF